MSSKRRVVVTGMGACTPLGCTLDAIWSRLVSGFNGIGPITHFDATGFPVTFAGEVRDFDAGAFFDAKRQARMDRYSWFALAAARMAVANAGVDWSKTDPNRCGALVGSGVGGLGTVQQETAKMLERGPTRMSPFTVPMIIANIASGLIAIEHNLRGPNYGVCSACATGLHCIGDAARIIERGDADIMLAGGAESAINGIGVASFASMRALSTRNDSPETASRPFDKDRNGFVMGEGAGVLVLEEYENARARGADILAEVAGYGCTCDAHHITAPAENGDGAARAMALAMRDAGVGPEAIGYVNAHGTSTPMNDRIETMAIKTAFGEDLARKVMISSTKSMTGHMLGAAGAFESIACILAMRNGVVPPTINYTTPDPDCDLDYVPNTAREASVDVCLNNAFGFGGHNACAVFRKV